MKIDEAFTELPLVAILRGIRPDEAESVGDALYRAGFRVIEVPLNSPEPYESISRLVRHFGERAIVGAGTVLSIDDAAAVKSAGGRLIVMPHTNPLLISYCAAQDLYCVPGAVTPSEVFACFEAGANAVKLFPAEVVRPAVVKSLRSVVPQQMRLLPVGGITPASVKEFRAAGASGFGLGGALYAPGMSGAQVLERAREFVRAWRASEPERRHE